MSLNATSLRQKVEDFISLHGLIKLCNLIDEFNSPTPESLRSRAPYKWAAFSNNNEEYESVEDILKNQVKPTETDINKIWENRYGPNRIDPEVENEYIFNIDNQTNDDIEEEVDEEKDDFTFRDKVVAVEDAYERIIDFANQYDISLDLKKSLLYEDFENIATHCTTSDHIKVRFEGNLCIVDNPLTKQDTYKKIYDELDVVFGNVNVIPEISSFPHPTQNIIYTFMRLIENYGDMIKTDPDYDEKIILIEDLEKYYMDIHALVGKSEEDVFASFVSILENIGASHAMKNEDFEKMVRDTLLRKKFYRFGIDKQDIINTIENSLEDVIDEYCKEQKSFHVEDYYKSFNNFTSDKEAMTVRLGEIFNVSEEINVVYELKLDETCLDRAVPDFISDDKVELVRLLLVAGTKINNYLCNAGVGRPTVSEYGIF